MERLPPALHTPVCDLLGIEVPILQAGMGWIAYGRLAAAVSSAGGLGVIGAGTNMPAAELRREIRLVRSLTDRPFGVDILFAAVQSEAGAAAVYTEGVSQMIEVALEERVPVLVSGLGSPKAVIPQAHTRGMKVLSVVGAVRHARKAVADGVDAVIATGCDGGGHVGKIGTAALVPAVVDAVDVPVVAGGGLADGRGLAAALALGAQGVWLGTRFIAAREANAHVNYKNRIVESSEAQTVVTRAHSGKPCRMLRNKFTDEWAAREADIRPYPLQLEVGHRASDLGRRQGDVENGVLPAGQSCGLIRDAPSASEIVRRIAGEACAALARLAGETRPSAPKN